MYLLILFSLFFASCSVSADEYNIDTLDSTQEFASRQIFTLTNTIDNFFGERKTLDHDNGSRLRVYSIISKSEGSQLYKEVNYRFRIRLPQLSKKLHIEFYRSKAETETLTPVNESILQTDSDRETSTPRLGLGYALSIFRGWESKAGAGIKVRLPPDPYLYYRMSKKFTMPKGFIRVAPSANYSIKDMFSLNGVVDYDIPLAENYLFRFSNTGTWTDKADITRSSHGPQLFQTLSKRRSISYSLSANFSSEIGYRIENYLLQLDYRQLIYKKWIYYDLIPSINYPKENGFKKVLGIALKLEILFGERS